MIGIHLSRSHGCSGEALAILVFIYLLVTGFSSRGVCGRDASERRTCDFGQASCDLAKLREEVSCSRQDLDDLEKQWLSTTMTPSGICIGPQATTVRDFTRQRS